VSLEETRIVGRAPVGPYAVRVHDQAGPAREHMTV
jgi:hypothetical protein